MPTEIGPRLQQLRLAAGLSQQALGERLGLAGRGAAIAVSHYETGFRTPSMRRLHELAAALGVAPSELLEPVECAAEKST